jgi:hypothetical protein
MDDDLRRRVRTSALGHLGVDMKTALMDEVESLDGVARVEDARNIDLVRALAYHFYIHVTLRECGEHAPGDADHVAHLLSHQREDRHIAMHRYLKTPHVKRAESVSGRSAVDRAGGRRRGTTKETHDARLFQIANQSRLQLAVEHVLDGHTDKDLASADQVHDDAEAVERAEDPRKESVRDALAIRLDVEYDDMLFDRHGRRLSLPRRPGAVDDPV